MGKNDRKCLQCEDKYQVSRRHFGKEETKYCPLCFITMQKVTIQQLTKRLDKLTDQVDRANKATTILMGSEYFDDPALVINSLQKMLRNAQGIAAEQIVKQKTAYRKLTISKTKLLNMGQGVIILLDFVLKQQMETELWFTPLSDEEEIVQKGLKSLHNKIMSQLQDLTGGKRRNVID